MIGVLKALGADNFAIRKIFLSFSVFLIGRGMLWGNIIGVALCFIQSQFHLFKLDPATYYVDRVPVEFTFGLFVAECLYFAGVGADACRAVISGDAYSIRQNLFGLNEKILFLRFSVYPVLILFSYNAKVFFPYD